MIIEEGEVRGAVAAEHPPASVSAGFGLAAELENVQQRKYM